MDNKDFTFWMSIKFLWSILGTQLKTRIAKFVVDFAPVIYDTRKKEILKQLVP